MLDLPEGHPHGGSMRRKDREIGDRSEIDAIIHATNVMYLALADNNIPFLVPVFFAYNGASLYFHSARTGTKIGIMERNSSVCFAISIDHGVIENDTACSFEAKHRTVTGFGKATFVEDETEKVKALDMIVARFSDRKFEYPKANLDAVAVVRIDIESVKGKKFGFE